VNTGEVGSVRGIVVDVHFDEALPAIYMSLRAGSADEIAIEVMSQLDAQVVRGVALTPTQGRARGDQMVDTGSPLQVPVGLSILSRMFNVFGEPIDRGAPLENVALHSAHDAPAPLVRRSARSEVFETGIKMIDVLLPLERGGKSGLFGGAGVGKTVLLTVMIQNMIGQHEGSVSFAVSANAVGKVRSSTARCVTPASCPT